MRQGVRAWVCGALLAFGALGALGAGVGRVARADDAPTSLVDWLKGRGEDAGFAARRALYREHVGEEPYTGSLPQNMALLDALRRGGPAREGARRSAEPAPSTWRTTTQEGLTITYDLEPLRIGLELGEDWRYGAMAPGSEAPRVIEPHVLPTLPAGVAEFVSAAVLALKCKQFDDGLYAAVELAVQEGEGGKRDLLARLRERLAAASAADAAAEVVEAAARLGGASAASPALIRAAVERRLAGFEGDPLRSKPIGFYTWSTPLERVFRQDRMLQSRLAPEEAASVLAVLQQDPALRSAYERMVALYERLTNAYAEPDLRALLAPASSVELPRHVHLLAPARAHETDLYKRLLDDGPLPAGMTVMDALIAAVRSGKVSLEPTATSGWYDHQTWALEPLLRPERTPEAPHLVLGERYCAYLVELFKGLLALTRETHIKTLDDALGAMMPRVPDRRPIGVTLPFTVEPLPTHYARRAASYAFVREVLRAHLGGERLTTLHRLTAEGPVALSLAQELDAMERLLRGASETSRRELGLPADEGTAGAEARQTFEAWARGQATDPDLARDARMMVPLGRDRPGGPMRVWVFLGWTQQTLNIRLDRSPRLVRAEGSHEGDTWNGEVYFTISPGAWVVSPVVAEVQVTQLLNRQEMRAHCDRWKTRSAILANLR